MKDCVQWNRVRVEKILPQAGLEPNMAISVGQLSYRGFFMSMGIGITL